MNYKAQSLAHVLPIAVLSLLVLTSQAGAQVVGKVPATAPTTAARSSAAEMLLRMPLTFEPAEGSRAMIARTGNSAVRIDAGGNATFFGRRTADAGTKGEAALPATVTLRLAGANEAAAVRGVDLQTGVTNYLLGNDPARWRHHVAQFGQARVADVYPGIDLVYYGNGRELEHDYLVGAHTNPHAIRMQFSAGVPALEADGALVLRGSTQGPELLRLRRPVAYQEVAGRRTAVNAAYVRNVDGTYGFTLGAYDASQPLVIDPIITYSTYFGGSNSDSVVGMQIDGAGNIYLLLSTQSIDMKTAGGPSGTCNGTCGVNNPNPTISQQADPDFFIAKFNAAGTTLVYGTYIGGSSPDTPQTLAVDSTGAVYAWGQTASTDFPVKNAFQSTPPAGLSASNYVFAGVLVKLSADGSQLLYSTYFAAGVDQGSGGYAAPDRLAVAPNGIVYVAGYTGDSNGQSFPSAKNAQFTGGQDFVAKFDTTQSGANSLLYATPVGPVSSQNSRYNYIYVGGLAVDSKANLWISGTTLNTGFPVTTSTAVQAACGYPNQCNSPYLMELDPTGQSTLYATFFGGTVNTYGGPGIDYATGLALDSQDNIYWGGRTEDSDFPTKNPAYTAADYGGDGWVAQFAAGGYPVLYSSYLPCTPTTVGGFKSASDPFLSYLCQTSTTNYPLKNAISGGRASGYASDAYFGIFDPSKSGASSVLVESYLGTGTAQTIPNKTVFDYRGNLWLAGGTNATDLPVQNSFQSTCDMCSSVTGGSSDGFVTRIALVQIAPTSIAFPSTNVGSASTTMTATISSLYGAAITLGTGTLTDSTDFTATDNCGGTVAAYGSCVVTFTFTPKTGVALSSTYSINASDATGVLANLSVSLNGTGVGAPKAVFSPTTLTYTTVYGTQAASQTTVLTNSGSATLSFYSFGIGGTNAGSFGISSNNCGPSLAAGGSCSVTIALTATAIGTYSATLTATDTASPATQTVALSGTIAAGTPAPAFLPTTLTYTTVVNTQAYNQATTLMNSGAGVLNISSLAISGTNASSFTIVTTTCGATLAAGASCTVTVDLTSITAGTYAAVLTATDNASPTTQTVALNGVVTGTAAASFSPIALTYSSVPGTQPYNQTTMLTNSGTGVLNIGSILLSGVNASTFTIVTNGCGSTLNAGASCSVTVGCTSISTGTYTATLTATDNATPTTQSVALSCTVSGTAQAALAPLMVNFGNVNVGVKSAASTITLSNAGSAALGINSISLTGTNAGSYAIASNGCGLTLAAGGSCAVMVTFSPTAAGSASAALTVIDAVGTQTSVLSGVGMATATADFTIASTPASQSTYRGATVSYNVQLSALSAGNPFTSAVTMSVAGLPGGATASFSPASVVPGAQASTTLTVTVPTLVGQSTPGPLPGQPARDVAIALAMVCGFGLFRRRRSTRRLLFLLIPFALLAGLVTGCGSGNGFAVATSTSTLTVTGTSGAIAHSTTVTLTIQ